MELFDGKKVLKLGLSVEVDCGGIVAASLLNCSRLPDIGQPITMSIFSSCLQQNGVFLRII
ncbi:MAG: hypothetical protein QMB11_06575 [Nonlabens sp.]|uniref:hypothetical protein n=1 Tax=Nonlabens sp. TaxID=1888209 RepID=UPI0035A58B12